MHDDKQELIKPADLPRTPWMHDDAWAKTVDLIHSAGLPWPVGMVKSDLAYWRDREAAGREWPSHSELAHRWHWTEADVHSFLNPEDGGMGLIAYSGLPAMPRFLLTCMAHGEVWWVTRCSKTEQELASDMGFRTAKTVRRHLDLLELRGLVTAIRRDEARYWRLHLWELWPTHNPTPT